MDWHVRMRRGWVGVTLTCTVLLFGIGCDTVEEDEVDEFASVLAPLNVDAQAGLTADASAAFFIDDDALVVEVVAENVAPDMAHPQHIHTMSECPGPDADTNDDGFIDAVEAGMVYGDILLPLDSELEDQDEGTFAVIDDDGYIYEASAGLDNLLDELRAEDDDIYAELGEDENLDLATRTVVIHGVSEDVELPETVQSFGGLPAHQTLPIACGEIALVD